MTERRERAGERERGGDRKLGLDLTHRGGWAIGPGSTPPSFVLTPAAFPPVRLFAIPLPAPPVLVHGRREVPRIASVGGGVGLPLPVSLPAVIQASVAVAVSSVKRPPLRGTIVKAATP